MGIKEDMQDIKNDMKEVSYIAFEACQARNEAREKRHFIIELVLIILLVVTNGAWLWYESRMEKVTETTTTFEGVEQSSEGDNIIVGGDMYGEAEN